MKQGLIVVVNGDRHWYKDDRLHRLDGPAIDQYGLRHRVDGPAVEWADGTKEWYIYGIEAKSEEQFHDPAWRAEVLLQNLK